MSGAGHGIPRRGTILRGPFWPAPVRVTFAESSGEGVHIEAVGLTDRIHHDLHLSADQFAMLDAVESSGVYAFDASPRLFRIGAEALRTHLAHSFDPQYAVSVSQVDPLPHQLDAVYRRMLPQPRIRFLLADDPGAGKTIMAGLLMRELMQRQAVRRVVVFCPKALTDQWRRELWERFRERFTVLTGEMIGGAYGQNLWREHDRVIASIDLAVQEHVTPGLDNAEWDLVIFDEAHRLSAYRYGPRGKIDKTRRYQMAERVVKRTRHLLLMTATPHRGDEENFRLLLSLLDAEVFGSQAGLRRALDPDSSPYFLRRMKEQMKDFEGRPLFLPRHVHTPGYELEPHESELYEAVTEYVASGLSRADSQRNRNVALALTILQRRMASSLQAITRSLERRRDRLAAALEASRATGARVLRDEESQYGAIPDDDEEELTEDQEEALSAASLARTAAELEIELDQVGALIAKARAAAALGPEKKLRELQGVLADRAIGAEKVLIFTEHRDTLDYLTRRLKESGCTVCSIHGGMPLQERIAAEKQFRAPGTQFLVATDAAGEGINLQFCKVMINWDLPWNPNRLEQRMGRIHRYGQLAEVNIFNLVASNTREGEVMVRLMRKLESMRAALGKDQVYDVISAVLASGNVRLDALMREAIWRRRSRQQILAELDFVDGEAARARAREVLTEALATSHIDLAFVEGEQRTSKERRLTPEFVERFFVDALTFLGGRISRGPDLDWRLDFVPAELRRAVQALNTGEMAGEARLITFHKERLRREPVPEFVAPDHPLFDVVCNRARQLGEPALLTGTAFVDREATAPYLVWLLEAAAVNGEGQVVHRRLLALRQKGGVFEPVEPAIMLDLAPAEAAPAISMELRLAADTAAAVQAATGAYSGGYLAEVTAAQSRQVEIVEKALDQSVRDRLAELQSRLERQSSEADAGADMAIALRTTNQEIDELTRAERARRASLARQGVVSVQMPRIVGVAAVIPGPVPMVVEHGLKGGDRTAVELAAMKVVMDHETVVAGRKPIDVSKKGLGYDIRSEGADGSVRYIEVKGHATHGDISLYYTEWQMAQRMRGEYFIYVVEDALEYPPKLWIIQDPVGKGIEPTERVVEYQIAEEDLRPLAERGWIVPSGVASVEDVQSRVIPEMVDRLVKGFDPLKVILFGSHARGDAKWGSDVDLLVVVDGFEDRRSVQVAMRGVLDDLGASKDVVVTTPEEIARRGDVVGTVLLPALREGRVLYERA